MIDPAVKIALAFCVVLGGYCAAMLFHRDRPRPDAVQRRAGEELLLRYRTDVPAHGMRARKQPRNAGRPASSDDAGPVAVLTPSARREPPPSLSPEYPETQRPAGSGWGASMEMMLPVVRPAEKTTHTVVDGDSLPALAERYLGSADRANEIYEANRDLLHDPALLPIGVELKLPPRGR